ncbi:MAG TPA: hypothetical protein VES73_05150 [Lamprocystis sp. (in: g-proteobacteria)]|nr:hypothetical protein [Lamprocystis sp. (in: g-proteobacteria)]
MLKPSTLGYERVRGRHNASSTQRFLSLTRVALLFAFAGCASTTSIQITPSPQEAVCLVSTNAQILWLTQWRADQKDVLARATAAADGLSQFFMTSGCFKSASIQRLSESDTESIQTAVAEAKKRNEKVVVIVVRELGPIIKIGASLALLEGGTEVALDISEYTPANPEPRTFNAVWRSGGPGVIKGVAALPQDLQAALQAALQPSPR